MNPSPRRPSSNPSVASPQDNRSVAAKSWLWLLAILGLTLLALFCESFKPERILFVNDTTLGQLSAAANRLPAAFTGRWHSNGWLGIEGVVASPTLSSVLALILPPVIYLKVYAPFTLLFLGFSAWLFFCQLEFTPAVCVLGGIAAALNMHFFSVACWGLGSWNMSAAMIFLALAVLYSKAIPQVWAKGILGGLAVGMNVMEGNDVGAISAIFFGSFLVWHNLTQSEPFAKKAVTALAMEALVVVCAALIAAHSISSLVDTQVQGVVGTGQDEQTKEKRWNPATQWSLPKAETLSIVVPGLFGYRMSGRITTPDKSSSYWGTIGQDPRLSALESDDRSIRTNALSTLNLPDEQIAALSSDDAQVRRDALRNLLSRAPTMVRYVGSGEYAGVLVCLLALFAFANSCRGPKTPFTGGERTDVWFWSFSIFICLLASWGRHAFLYKLLYQLPYISTIRNPIKFMQPFHIGCIILAGYGMEILRRRYLQASTRGNEALPDYLQKWWANIAGFEKRWVLALLALLALAVAAVFVYSANNVRLIEYLEDYGTAAQRAVQMAAFSVVQARWWVAFFAVATALVIVALSGAWSGRNANIVWVLMGLFLIVDLGRSDIPWIHYFDYQKEYSENSVLDFLADKPYEHRVIGRLSPKGLGSGIGTPIGRLYDYWQQNAFPYYNIQSLDFAQWPRVPVLDSSYMKNFALHGEDLAECNLWPTERLWELTNTRYIVCTAPIVPLLSRFADSRHSFTVKTFLRVERKSDVAAFEDVGDLTAVPDARGNYALVEMNNCLPRVQLYSHWESPTNDDATLQTLASRDFNPEQTLLVAQDTPVGQPSGNASVDAGSADISDYRPKYVKIEADPTVPSVLLLNDRIAPQWKVWVDKKPASILRCNYIMRGVFLTPGHHVVEYRFQPPLTSLYVSLCACGLGILTAGYLVYSRVPAPAPTPTPAPIPPTAPVTPVKAPVVRPAETAGRSNKRRR